MRFSATSVRGSETETKLRVVRSRVEVHRSVCLYSSIVIAVVRFVVRQVISLYIPRPPKTLPLPDKIDRHI